MHTGVCSAWRWSPWHSGLPLDWWIGLASVGWLLFDPTPARRILGSWWLILSVMTPFYHPYARLWLPLEAAGWLVMADLLVLLGSFSKSVTDEPRLGAVAGN